MEQMKQEFDYWIIQECFGCHYALQNYLSVCVVVGFQIRKHHVIDSKLVSHVKGVTGPGFVPWIP